MCGVTIRPAAPSELVHRAPLFEPLANLCALCLCAPQGPRELRQLARAQRDELELCFAGAGRRQEGAVGRSALWLAEAAGGELVGACGVQALVMTDEGHTRLTRHTKPRLALRPLLSNVVVAHEWRRRGIAARLIQESEDTARGWGFDEMMLKVDVSNVAAIQAYLRAGYRTVATDPTAERPRAGLIRVRWERTTLLCMRKELLGMGESFDSSEGGIEDVAVPTGG